MKRLLALGLAAGCLLALSGIAQAVVARGTYKGETSAGDPISFKVTRSKRVSRFSFSQVHLTCTDGDEFDTGTITTPPDVSFVITRGGRFGFEARNPAGGNGYDVAGRIASPKGKGTLRVFARFAEGNVPDPDGSILCDSGELTYRVKKT
jgi:hypothetical protein